MARALTAAAALSAAPADAAAGALVEPSALPLRTHGRHVVDRQGRRVQLACVNWYGAQQGQMVMNGLDAQPLPAIARTIVRLGFNCVRLPFSLELALRNRTRVPRANVTLRANPELQPLSPLELFDATVAGLTGAGLLVVLNQHISAAGWCCSNNDGEGLWYTAQYPEDDWLRGLGFMAGRYRHDPRVVGVDLRNEVRPFLSLIPTWGDGNPATDWAMAALKGARRVLAENPEALIVISGIHFGMRLAEVPLHPIHVSEPELRNRTVFTTHFYYGWCFDLMARDLLNRNRWALLFFASWLWLLLAADACADSQRASGSCGLGGRGRHSCSRQLESSGWHSASAWRTGSRGSSRPPAEFAVVAGLLGLLCLLLAVGEHLGQTCGHIHIVSPPAFVVVSGMCFKLLYLVWTRILLAYTAVLLLCPCATARDELLDSTSFECVEPPEEEASFQSAASSSSCSSKREPGPDLWLPVSGQGSPSNGKGDVGRLLAHCRGHASECCAQFAEEPDDAGPLCRLSARCRALCGRRACLRLAEPLRARKGRAALASLGLLGALTLVRLWCGSYTAFARELDACWGGLLGSADASAPVWLSEFGTDDDGLYWAYLLRYMKERELDFAYWSINGEKRFNESETYGLLSEDSITVRQEWKLRTLQELIIRPRR
mmetsp:Transcript_108516/g.338239  ORF Transcript_108516/g.338239 Transcript_108516/m.338239 type:complete len:661 (+) Transcript_108516:17-1999(+)